MRPLLDERGQAQLDAIVSSPVPPEKVAHFLELAYAHGAALPKDLRDAAADVGAFASQNRFYHLDDDQRGQKMVAALRLARFRQADGDPAPGEMFRPGNAAPPLP